MICFIPKEENRNKISPTLVLLDETHVVVLVHTMYTSSSEHLLSSILCGQRETESFWGMIGVGTNLGRALNPISGMQLYKMEAIRLAWSFCDGLLWGIVKSVLGYYSLA